MSFLQNGKGKLKDGEDFMAATEYLRHFKSVKICKD